MHKKHQPHEQGQVPPKKKNYQSPTLVNLGNVATLVAGSHNCQYETGGGRTECG